MRARLLFLIVLAVTAATLLASCGGGSDAPAAASQSAQAATVAASETAAAASATAVERASTSATSAAETQAAQPTATPPTAAHETSTVPRVQAPQPTPTPSGPPTSGRWIDVNVSSFVVRLMDGQSATRTISPVAVGEQIDTGIYNSTETGLFHVYSMDADLTYDAPYDTYISNWVGFDPALDNGFHSFLEDETGKVVDASTGRVSNGCIRTGDSAAIFAFAEIGMPVYVHA